MAKPTRRITKQIKAELDRLARISRGGRLQWEDVVRAAKNRSNPLHSYFDWNKNAAMQAYMRSQAEELITGYYLSIIHPVSGEKVRTRAFISLSSDRHSGGGYRPIMDVLSDAEMKRQMIDDALADLASFRQRYKELKELSQLFDEIEKLNQQHRPRRRNGMEQRASA